MTGAAWLLEILPMSASSHYALNHAGIAGTNLIHTDTYWLQRRFTDIRTV